MSCVAWSQLLMSSCVKCGWLSESKHALQVSVHPLVLQSKQLS